MKPSVLRHGHKTGKAHPTPHGHVQGSQHGSHSHIIGHSHGSHHTKHSNHHSHHHESTWGQWKHSMHEYFHGGFKGSFFGLGWAMDFINPVFWIGTFVKARSAARNHREYRRLWENYKHAQESRPVPKLNAMSPAMGLFFSLGKNFEDSTGQYLKQVEGHLTNRPKIEDEKVAAENSERIKIIREKSGEPLKQNEIEKFSNFIDERRSLLVMENSLNDKLARSNGKVSEELREEIALFRKRAEKMGKFLASLEGATFISKAAKEAEWWQATAPKK